jgi:hypothetical protein
MYTSTRGRVFTVLVDFPLFGFLQNMLGYDRIEGSRTLNQDEILKETLGIKGYPDPETFRDKLMKYTGENVEQLFLVNQKLIDVLCRLTKPRAVELHFDYKVISIYGDMDLGLN